MLIFGLRKDALVEVDEKNRIIKYRAHDGSLEMEGDHNELAKSMEGLKRKNMRSEKIQEDSDDGSVKTPLPTTSGPTKRAAVAEVQSSSKRTRNSSLSRLVKEEDYTADDSLGIPESRAREFVRQFSPQPPTPREQSYREPKMEETPVAIDVRTRQEAPNNAPKTSGAPGAHDLQEAPRGAPITPKAQIPVATPIKTEPEADEAYTSQIKFLETIHFLVINLDMPSLTLLKSKIEKKLRESPNAKIPTDEIIPVIELLINRITNNSVPNLPGNVESVSLREFLCYLKSVILNSKLEGFEWLMEKIKERIKETTLKDKNIPMEKVASALQSILDVIGF